MLYVQLLLLKDQPSYLGLAINRGTTLLMELCPQFMELAAGGPQRAVSSRCVHLLHPLHVQVPGLKLLRELLELAQLSNFREVHLLIGLTKVREEYMRPDQAEEAVVNCGFVESELTCNQ